MVEREEDSQTPQLKATESQLMAEWEKESRTLQLKAIGRSHSKWWERPPTGRNQAQLSRRQRQLQSGGRWIKANVLPVAMPRMKVDMGFR